MANCAEPNIYNSTQKRELSNSIKSYVKKYGIPLGIEGKTPIQEKASNTKPILIYQFQVYLLISQKIKKYYGFTYITRKRN